MSALCRASVCLLGVADRGEDARQKKGNFSVVHMSRAPPQIIATGNNIYYSHHIAIATYLQSDRTSDSQDISPPERATLGHSL